MALHHASSGEIIDVRPYGERLKQEIPKTLVKTPLLQVFRYVLLAGKEFAEHKVSGGITVQCLEGVVLFTAHEKTQILRAGQLVFVAKGVPHALKGVEDASVLVTIVSTKQA
ncbi:MAG: cupin domain-containing protein [Rhodanobacter sp.]